MTWRPPNIDACCILRPHRRQRAAIPKSEGIEAGELIGSGTIGFGCGLELGKFLTPGDVVELEVKGIGVLRNRIGTPSPADWMPEQRMPAAM